MHYYTQTLKATMAMTKLPRLTHGGNVLMYMMNKFPILQMDKTPLLPQIPKTMLELKLRTFLWNQQGLQL